MKEKRKIKISHKGLWITALIVFILIYSAVQAARLYLNYINIYEIGSNFLSIYLQNVKADIIARILAFTVSVILICITNIILKRNLLKWEETAYFLNNKLLFTIMTLFLSIIVTIFIPYDLSTSALIAAKPTWFLQNDPIFGKNIGYYVFQRPFLMNVTKWVFALFVFILIYSAIIYLLYYVRNGGGKLTLILKQNGIVAHLAINVLLVFLLSAYAFNFAAEEMMFAKNGEMVGGKYTDIMVWTTYYKIAPYLLIFIVSAAIILILKKKTKLLIATVSVYPALWFVAVLCAVLVQNFVVRPNEASIERPYIKNNIEYTNRAYNLSDVSETEYPIEGKVTEDAISKNSEAINNIRIADYNATLESYNQLQGFRNYYQFKDIDVIPYTENGQAKAAYISAREINVSKSDKQSSSYINSKMRYTHGFGIVMSSISELTPEGLPKFIVKDMNDTSENSPVKVTQPRIYFGETDKSYVIVNSLQKELDYYNENTEKEYSYNGNAGIKLDFLNRILYACKYGDINLAISGYINDESKILTNRNVIERVKLAIPFLKYDEDAQIAVTEEGRLVWIVDGYTTTNYYPYSQRSYDIDKTFGTNYVRNSVKVIIDAYDGSVSAYIVDWNDPMVVTYNSVYPGIFSTEAMPAYLAAQIKYPKKLFQIQANIYRNYHNTNPSTFYSKSNVWEVAKEKYGENGEIKNIEPYYSIVNVNGASKLMIMQPFTLAGKDSNLMAWFAADSDIENYGKLTSYIFPNDKHVYGTLQIENKIDNDQNISKELASLKSDTSRLKRGNLLVVPIMGTIVYVEPIYVTTPSQLSLPELKKIIVVCGDTVVIDNTLSAAFKKLIELKPETGYSSPVTQPAKSVNDLSEALSARVADAIAKYNEAKQFSKENDWVNYGRAMKEFDDIMSQIDYKLKYPETDIPQNNVPQQ